MGKVLTTNIGCPVDQDKILLLSNVTKSSGEHNSTITSVKCASRSSEPAPE